MCVTRTIEKNKPKTLQGRGKRRMVLSFLIMLKKTVPEPDLIRERLEAPCVEFLSWVTRSIFLPRNYKYT